MEHSFLGKHVLVIGLGIHGGAVGTIQWLAQQGAVISVSDTKSEASLWQSIEKLKDFPNITYYFGNQDELHLDGVDMVIRNPGVPRTAPILERARKQNIPIEMDSSLFFAYSPRKNIIGITGSKGKTTASMAISAVMKAIDSDTITVGTDGVSPLGALTPLTRPSEHSIIFELSSWRLEPLQERKISPHIAIVTSIYKDHLDTYASFTEYIETKKQIFYNQTEHDIAIFNADDAKILTWENDVQGKLYWFSLERLGENKKGIWIEGKNIVTNATHSPHPNPTIICAVSDIPHTSEHELRNKLPAILIGILHGANMSTIIKALQNASELPHRLQFVRTIDGVRFINDSAATMPDATIAAIESFAKNPLIIILGGSDKALEFQDLATVIASHKNIWHLIWLPGTATQSMQECITPLTKVLQHNASNMAEAVRTAHSLAKQGDTILLSPGATSFGLFLHEFDRGDAFIRAVLQL